MRKEDTMARRNREEAGVSVKSAPRATVSVGATPEITTVAGTGGKELKTITAPRRESFPLSILVLAIICAGLFAYMIYNYVLINEHTNVLADLRAEISTLSADINDLNAKLDQKNDLTVIERAAREEYGMVSIDEVEKRYITMDFGDVIVKPEK